MQSSDSMPNEEKTPYSPASPADNLRIVDLSKPQVGTLHFKLIKEMGNKSVVLELVPPDAVTRYSYGGERFKCLKVSRSDLTTVFDKFNEVEYRCNGQRFSDFLDDAKDRSGGLSVEPYNPRH